MEPNKRIHVQPRLVLSIIAGAITMGSGCSQMQAPDRAERMTRGYVYYCDGAGGGGLLMNWSSGVRDGLVDAGYDGSGEMFRWETGLGVVADQTASVEYKKGKARQLADEIVKYKAKYPDAPVHIIGLSAGTAVVAYALEYLPVNDAVQNVVMLSGSLSSGYDLTQALRRVKGRMYIFTSQRDEVLLAAVPMVGTADRVSADGGTIGLNGARLPAGASQETRALYRKISVIAWNPQFARYGDEGGHTDSVKGPFVQQFVAPLIIAGSSRSNTSVRRSPTLVENPDYQRWARFPEGSWVLFEGYQMEGDRRKPIRVRTTLVEKEADRMLIQREAEGGDGELADELTQSFYVTRHIESRHHPLTHPEVRRTELGNRPFEIAGRNMNCKAAKVQSSGDFEHWGKNVSATVLTCPEIPGGIAQIDLSTTLDGRQVQLVGQAVKFDARR